MNELELIRIYNMRLYELNNELTLSRLSAYPKAAAYDSIGGSHGQPLNQIEVAYERADKIVTQIIQTQAKRDQMREEVRRMAYKADISEQEWFAVMTYYLITKNTGKPFKWVEVARCMADAYGIGERQAYKYRKSACDKILQILESGLDTVHTVC